MQLSINILIGYIGLVFLLFAYILLYFKGEREFLITNFIATFFLTLYAFIKRDNVFFFVNLFVLVMIFSKLIKLIKSS